MDPHPQAAAEAAVDLVRSESGTKRLSSRKDGVLALGQLCYVYVRFHGWGIESGEEAS